MAVAFPRHSHAECIPVVHESPVSIRATRETQFARSGALRYALAGELPRRKLLHREESSDIDVGERSRWEFVGLDRVAGLEVVDAVARRGEFRAPQGEEVPLHDAREPRNQADTAAVRSRPRRRNAAGKDDDLGDEFLVLAGT